MNADFQDAHARHWEDAELLFRSQRWANADHLYGVAAECGLKALIEAGQGVRLKGDDFVHVMDRKKPGAWDRYVSYHAGVLGPQFSLTDDNPFADWDVSDRYVHRGQFDARRTELHRGGAAQVAHLVAKAHVEGLLA